jgi:hypothetical protein
MSKRLPSGMGMPRGVPGAPIRSGIPVEIENDAYFATSSIEIPRALATPWP